MAKIEDGVEEVNGTSSKGWHEILCLKRCLRNMGLFLDQFGCLPYSVFSVIGGRG